MKPSLHHQYVRNFFANSASTDFSQQPMSRRHPESDPAISIAPDDETNTATNTNTPAGARIKTSIVSMDEILNICKHRGFIFVSGDLYNAPAGFFDYGTI